MSKSLFVLYTPYQLISAINIVKMLGIKNADCLIMHKNLLMYKKSMGIYFSGDIYFFEELTEQFFKKTKFTRLDILLRIMYAKRYVKKKKVLKKIYDELYVPSDEAICRVVYKEMVVANPSVKLNLIDDGVGTYEKQLFANKRWISRIVYSLLLTKRYSENIKRIFCYHPKLLTCNPFDAEICKIKYNGEFDIFRPFVKKYIDLYVGKKVIFLDQGKFSDQSKKVLLYLAESFGKNNILIKMHPRIGECQNFYDGYTITDDGLPFEAIISEVDCSSCLVVSYSSTGCITPYLLFGIKPKVVFYYCMDNTDYSTTILESIDKINSIEGEEYINVPKSKDEFIRVIQEIRECIKPIQLRAGR